MTHRNVYQSTFTVSIPKQKLVDIASDDGLDEQDFRVLFILLTILNGWSESKTNKKDPENYTKISAKMISDTIGIGKKKVSKSIEKLVEYGLIEPGDSDSVKDGFRFTF